MFGSILGLSPLDASSTYSPAVTTENTSRHAEMWSPTCPDTPGSCPWLTLTEGTHSLKQPRSAPVHVCLDRGLLGREVSTSLVAFKVAWSSWTFQGGGHMAVAPGGCSVGDKLPGTLFQS